MTFEGFDKKRPRAESLESADELLNRAIRKGKESLSAKERQALNEEYPGILDPEDLDEPYYKEGSYH